MKYTIHKQIKRGSSYEILYSVYDDADNLIIGGVQHNVGKNLLSETELDLLFTETIFPNLEAQSDETIDQGMQEEVSTLELSMLEQKRLLKQKIILHIKTTATPTVETVVSSLPEFSENFIRYLIDTYIEASFSKGYIPDKTWESFVADIQTTSIEDLEARR